MDSQSALNDEAIVISGMSGRFPESQNVEEFKNILYNGIDVITEDDRRYTPGLYNTPKGLGKLKDIKHFDADFFNIKSELVPKYDVQARLLLEVAFEAIVDAGMNPTELKGTNAAVYVGVWLSDSLTHFTMSRESSNGYELLGGIKTILANTVSHFFGFLGPSMALDAGCASSLYALNLAYHDLKSGRCEYAIVAGTNLTLNPAISLAAKDLGFLSGDGKCRSFDESSSGFASAESIVAIFLQKAKASRRIYATVVHSVIGTNGYASESIGRPDAKMLSLLMQRAYSESGVNVDDIRYLEAHAATRVGDVAEGSAITSVYCENRKTPLLIGSVKSNMGHSITACGLCSIVKVLLSFETGTIPANLHYQQPNQSIPALLDGRLKVVTQNSPLEGDMVGINSYGVGGTISHAILQRNLKAESSVRSTTNVPLLVTVSGRNKEAVDTLLKKVTEVKKNKAEFVSLIHHVHANDIAGHQVRGFSILDEDSSVTIAEEVKTCRPVWIVFPGLGCHSHSSAKELLKFDVIKRSLKESAGMLSTLSINLMDIIENGLDTNPINIGLFIISVQLALVDLLRSIGIKPSGIIGHSMGEMSCAYADGAWKKDQVLFAAYWRMKVLVDTAKNRPMTFSLVMLNWQEVEKKCPPGVSVACHNSATATTIAGEMKVIERLIEQFKEEGIFASIMDSYGIVSHCPQVHSVRDKLSKALAKIVKNAQPKRTSRWISSSIPEELWNSDLALYSSVEYHVNNICSPVLFHEALSHVPEDAIVLELAPNAVFQSLIKANIPSTVTSISFCKISAEDPCRHLLQSIGNLYNCGAQVDLTKLYKIANFPAARGTEMISPLIKWNHSTEWQVPQFPLENSPGIVKIDLSKSTNKHFLLHVRQEKPTYPMSGLIDIVRRCFIEKISADEDIPVVFEDVQLHREVSIRKDQMLQFKIDILDKMGTFVLTENDIIVLTGTIQRYQAENYSEHLSVEENKEEHSVMSRDDFYNELKARNLHYTKIFRIVKTYDSCKNEARVCWHDYVTFITGMFQIHEIYQDVRVMNLPIRINRLVINPKKHEEFVESHKDKKLPVYFNKNTQTVSSGGIELEGYKLTPLVKKTSEPTLEYNKHVFVPYHNEEPLHIMAGKAKLASLSLIFKLARENLKTSNLSIAEIGNNCCFQDLMFIDFLTVLKQDLQTANLHIVNDEMESYEDFMGPYDVEMIVHDIKQRPTDLKFNLIYAENSAIKGDLKIMKNLTDSLTIDGFLIIKDATGMSQEFLTASNLSHCATQQGFKGNFGLFRKKCKPKRNITITGIEKSNFSWISKLQVALKDKDLKEKTLILVSLGKEAFDLASLVECVLLEFGEIDVRYFYIDDEKSPSFSLESDFYSKQMQMEMVANVYKNGNWGCYHHLPAEYHVQKFTQMHYAHMESVVLNNFNTVQWVQSPLGYYDNKLDSEEKFCTVYNVGLTYKDIMITSSELVLDAFNLGENKLGGNLGTEFSGRDEKGTRIMGLVQGGALATHVISDPVLHWQVPDEWTLEQAATVPFIYVICYYAFFIKTKLFPSETVLVRCSGQPFEVASIAIALAAKCRVYAAVNSTNDRDTLKKIFSALTDDDFIISEESKLKSNVMSKTKNKGVDSVCGNTFESTLDCLKDGGRFIQLPTSKTTTIDSISAKNLISRSINYHHITIESIFQSNNECKKELARLIQEGINNKVVSPLPFFAGEYYDVPAAFAKTKVVDKWTKVIVKVNDEEEERVVQLPPQDITAIARTYFDPDKSYIVIDSSDGLATEIIYWMISRGAMNICISNHPKVNVALRSYHLDRWASMGINVTTFDSNLTDLKQAEEFLKNCNSNAPVGGIFNFTCDESNCSILDTKEEQLKLTFHSKVNVTRNLDVASRNVCKNLNYFVVSSAIQCLKGIANQVHSCLADSAMKKIIEARKTDGLPGLIIQWSPMNINYDATSMNDETLRVEVLTVPQVLKAMDELLQQKDSAIYPFVPLKPPSKHVQRRRIINVLETVKNMLNLKKLSVDESELSQLGIDSALAAEIIEIVQVQYSTTITPEEIRKLTFLKLKKLLLPKV